MKVPLLSPVVDDAMVEAAVEALRTEYFVSGPSVARFEEAFAEFCGTDHAVAVSSGTHALQFALEALGVGPGDEVLTSPFTFVATANAVLHAGATPRFADVDPETWDLDPGEAAEAVTDETAVLLPVHIFGRPADMDALSDLADDRGLAVVEDACQAHGATVDGVKAGALGDVGCFSFYSTKNMTVCGDGGMVTTDDADVAAHVAKLRDCGRTSRYEHDVLGYTARLNTMNAAIGAVQLERLPAWNGARRDRADRYRDLLDGVDGVTLPAPDRPGDRSVWHLFVVLVDDRDRVAEELAERGVETGRHYPIPVHLQPLYRERFGYRGGEFPVAEDVAERALALPLFPTMTDEQQDHVVRSLTEVAAA